MIKARVGFSSGCKIVRRLMWLEGKQIKSQLVQLIALRSGESYRAPYKYTRDRVKISIWSLPPIPNTVKFSLDTSRPRWSQPAQRQVHTKRKEKRTETDPPPNFDRLGTLGLSGSYKLNNLHSTAVTPATEVLHKLEHNEFMRRSFNNLLWASSTITGAYIKSIYSSREPIVLQRHQQS